MDKLGKIKTTILIICFIILTFFIIFISSSQAIFGIDFSPDSPQNQTLIKKGINYETYKTSENQFNTIIYSESIYFNELVNLTQEGDDLILNVDGRISRIKLKINDGISKKTITDLKGVSNEIIYSTQINRDLDNKKIKFGWDLDNLPPNIFNIMKDIEIEIESQSEVIEIENGWLIDNIRIDLFDIIQSNFSLERNTSEPRKFKVKENLQKGKSFKSSNIFLDPTLSPQYSSKDTYIDGFSSVTQNRNFGNETVMRVEGDREYRSLVQFDLSSIVANATISIANLHIYGATGTTGTDLEVNIINNSWDEGTGTELAPTTNGATWLNRTQSVAWDVAGGDFNTTVVGTGDYASQYISINISRGVEWIVKGLLTNNGFIISSPGTAPLSFNTRDFTGTGRDPYINITWSYPTPTMSFISPANNTVQSSSSVDFQCNATVQGVNSNANITKFEFYYCSGSTCDPIADLVDTINFNETNGITPGSNGNKTLVKNWTTTLSSDGIYRWACYSDIKFEDGTTTAFNSPLETLRTITIDTSKPLIQYVSPTETSGFYLNRNYLLVNVTATDSSLSNITIYLFNSTQTQVNSSNTTTSPNYINFSGLSDGLYFFNATALDQLNNQNSTATRNVTLDATKPLVSFGTGTENNGVNVSRTNIYVNVSITETNFANVTFLLYNSSSQVNRTTYSTVTYTINWTNLPNQNYTYNVSVTDLANNINTTETRRIKLDTVKPGVTIVNPLNGSYYTTSSIVFNVTLNEDGGIVQYTLNSGVNNLSMSSTNLRNYNATNTSIADGQYTFKVYSNDTAGNRNDTTSTIFTVDTTKPLLVINYPSNSSNFSTTSVQVNFTATETNLQSCKSSKNSGVTNTTRSCTTGVVSNFTDTYSEGLNTVFIYVNDSAGNTNQSLVTFRVDTTAPTISVAIPTSNGQNFSYQTNVNYTVSDSGVGLSSCWWTKDSGATNTTLTCGTNVTGQTWSEGSNTVTVYSNDTLNNRGSATRQFNVDTIFPLISYGIGTESDESNYSRSNIYVNVSVTETNEKNITFLLYNSTSQYNSTTFTTAVRTINWTSLADDTYTFNVTIRDYASNLNTTATRTVRIDNIAPSLTVLYPTNNLIIRDEYDYNISLNISISDLVSGVSTRFYSLNGGTNTTFTGNTTITPIAGNNTLLVYANDTVGNLNTSSLINFNLTFTPKINNINISNASTSYSRNDLQDGLVGWWKLDENNTNQIDSAGIQNATVVGINLSFTNNGKIGGAYSGDHRESYIESLDRDDYSIDKTNNFTVSFWMYCLPNSIGYAHPIGKGNSGNYEWYFRTTTNCGSIAVTTNNNSAAIDSAITYTADLADKWTFVGATWMYNGTTMNRTLYVNGDLITNNLLNVDYANDVANLRLFDRYDSRNWNGSIDEVRIYNRSLSATEISNLYSITNPTFQEYANVTINTTITDEDTPQASLYYEWFVDGVSKLAGFAQNIFNWIFNRENQKVTLVVNDSSGYNVTQEWNITTTFVNPLIQFVSPTENSGNNFSRNYIIVNISFTEINFQNITFELFNNTALVNKTTYSSQTTLINWSSLSNTNYNYNVTITDKVNSKNTTETRQITLDTTAPTLTILSPEESQAFSTNTSLNLNYSVSDDLLLVNSCWFNLDNGANTTITSCLNTTFNTTEGSHVLYLFANDSVNNIATKNVSFVVSLNISVNLNYPPNNAYLNFSQNVYLNYTGTSASLQSCTIYHNASGTFQANITNYGVTSDQQNFSIFNFTDSSIKWNVLCNNSVGNTAWGVSNRTFTIDTIRPLISYGTGTQDNEYNTTATNIYVNVSVTETNEANITFYLYNSTGNVQTTFNSTQGRTVNWTSLADEVYKYNVTIIDLANNKNTTSTRTLRIDTTAPELTILSPSAINYAQTSFDLNYSVTDNLIGVNTCWYNIRNLSNSVYLVSNTTLSNCGNTTFSVHGGDYDYELNLYANDTLNNLASISSTVGVRTISPAVVLNNPTSAQHFNRTTNIRFNFTATDLYDGISSCRLEGNWTGTWHINQTLTSITSTVQTNFNLLNLTENSWGWNVWCNDTYNNNAYAQSNQTFTLDITYPLINITTPTNASTQTSSTVSVKYILTELHPNICKWSKDGGVSNTTLSCGSNISDTFASGSNTVNIYSIDSAGNENSSQVTFTVSLPSTSGGGGGGSTTTTEIPVIALQDINSSEVYSDLTKAILYATINNYCSNKINKEPLAIVDYSQQCQLTTNDLLPIINNLKAFTVDISEEDLRKFLENYKQSKFLQTYATEENIKEYGLFTSVLGETTIWLLTPPSIDSYFTIFNREGTVETLPRVISSNKGLKSCEVVSNTPSLICEVTSNYTAKLSYEITDTNFFTKTFSGTILLTTDAEPERTEQRRSQVTFRVINFGSNTAIYSGAGIVGITIFLIFIIVKRKRVKFSRQVKELVSLK